MPETDDPAPDDPAIPAERFLTGQILIAMPSMTDPRFHRSLVFMCAHSADGAMGLIVNRPADRLTLADLYSKLSIPLPEALRAEAVRYGGPVETGRGFVLHSADYDAGEATLDVTEAIGMTPTVEVLHAIASDEGPARRFVALGYAGWAPGQIEAEIRANCWLLAEADDDLLFGPDHGAKWDAALARLGISAALLHPGGSA